MSCIWVKPTSNDWAWQEYNCLPFSGGSGSYNIGKLSGLSNKHLVHIVLETGKAKIKVEVDPLFGEGMLPGLQPASFPCILTWLIIKLQSISLHVKGTNLTTRALPSCNLIISQKLHLLIPLGVRITTWTSEGHEHSSQDMNIQVNTPLHSIQNNSEGHSGGVQHQSFLLIRGDVCYNYSIF